ncbi:hypothetical protein AB0E08_49310 [Streptomyces sp. NPDC048281]|uniref:hypothetical protein n=1 Tax=Streptomyces sp. NPDC048281 TaxID=3154715 RepID=UPI003424DD42
MAVSEYSGELPQTVTTITATDIVGTAFMGRGINPTTDSRIRQATIIAQAESDLPSVVRSVYTEQLRSIDLREGDKERYFIATDRKGKTFTVRVDSVPLPSGIVARTYVNTTTDNHIVQLSDSMDPRQVGRALSHELAETLAVRDRARAGRATHHQDFLTRGRAVNSDGELSDEDLGRVGELNYLAARMNDPDLGVRRRTEARSEFIALVDHIGIRSQAPIREAERRTAEQHAADLRRTAIHKYLSETTKSAVRQLAVPIERLGNFDTRAIQAFYARARTAPRSVSGATPNQPMPGFRPDGSVIPRQELATAAAQAAEQRTRASERTLDELRAESAQTGKWPTRKVVIGGGASLTGRTSDALLIDARGRWHLDPGEGIVQSADHVRALPATGIGHAHQFAQPTGRVPMQAIQFWQDTLAARGPVVDGHAHLIPGKDGYLYAEIKPTDGSKPIRINVEGTPTLATGVPPEVLPGVDSSAQTLPEALDALRKHLPASHPVRTQLASATTAQDALRMLGAGGVLTTLREDKHAEGALRTLNATAKWEYARAQAPGRVLLGDDIADNRNHFDPNAVNTWLITGSGGNAAANAEIILKANPDAHVTIVGSRIPQVLFENVQFNAVRKLFDATHGGDGRLVINIAPSNRVGAVQMKTSSNGQILFQEGNVEAEAYVSCVGRTAPLPQATSELGDWTRACSGRISGDLMFSKEQQYLGYGLTFEAQGQQHRIEVTGAASHQLPRSVFRAETQSALTAMTLRAVPPQTGSPPPGFAPTAWQAAQLAAARQYQTVELHHTVPDCWGLISAAARHFLPNDATARPATRAAATSDRLGFSSRSSQVSQAGTPRRAR